MSLDCIVVGPFQSGKTSMLLNFINKPFNEDFIPTIGVDSFNLTMNAIHFKIWDCSGQQAFQNLSHLYYKNNLDVALCVFDLSSRQSFKEVESYIIDVKNKCICPTILIGNKCDLIRKISFDEIEDLTKRWDLKYFEISSKLSINITPLVMYIATFGKIPIKVKEEKMEEKMETKMKRCLIM